MSNEELLQSLKDALANAYRIGWEAELAHDWATALHSVEVAMTLTEKEALVSGAMDRAKLMKEELAELAQQLKDVKASSDGGSN